MKIQKIVGYNLKYLRYQANLPQDKFYGQFGLNYRYLACVERGEINVSIVFLENLAKILKVDIREFFNPDSTRFITKSRIDSKEKRS